MLSTAELDEIRRQIRQRRHLSWATLDKLIASAIEGATPKPEPKIAIETRPARRLHEVKVHQAHNFVGADGRGYELCIHCFSSKEEAARQGWPCVEPYGLLKGAVG